MSTGWGSDQGQGYMGNFKTFTFLILAGTFISSAAFAADVKAYGPRAVSAPNGKIEIGGGFADVDSYKQDTEFYGAASFSIPLGDSFGLQADVANVNVFGENEFGLAGHAFTRDPASYLLGAYGGYADYGTGNAYYVGPEAELYLNNISIEATAGYLNLNPDVGASQDKFFGFADVAFYPTENLRFTVGASSVADFNTGHIGAEWLLSDSGMPISLKTNAQFGEENYYNITAGISIYFGGEDKSLIRRHREDDPRNRALDIFQAGGAGLGSGNGKKPPPPCDFECPIIVTSASR